MLNGVSGVTYTFTNDGTSEFVQISGGVVSAAWAVDANGAWTSSGSWTGGVPNGVGTVANFGGVITAPRTVTVSGTQTVATITFANANAYTVTGGTIVLDNGANGPAAINDTLGNHTIASAVTLNSNTSVNVATGNSLTLSGAVGGTGSLTATGAGVVVLSGANTYSGGTTVSAGTVQLAGSGTLGNVSNALSIASGATLDMNGASATVGSLSGAGTIDNVANAGASVLTTGGLNQNVTFSGVIKNTTGTVGITKVGTGNLTLSGTNTFTGPVTLTAGELVSERCGESGCRGESDQVQRRRAAGDGDDDHEPDAAGDVVGGGRRVRHCDVREHVDGERGAFGRRADQAWAWCAGGFGSVQHDFADDIDDGKSDAERGG